MDSVWNVMTDIIYNFWLINAGAVLLDVPHVLRLPTAPTAHFLTIYSTIVVLLAVKIA